MSVHACERQDMTNKLQTCKRIVFLTELSPELHLTKQSSFVAFDQTASSVDEAINDKDLKKCSE